MTRMVGVGGVSESNHQDSKGHQKKKKKKKKKNGNKKALHLSRTMAHVLLGHRCVTPERYACVTRYSPVRGPRMLRFSGLRFGKARLVPFSISVKLGTQGRDRGRRPDDRNRDRPL
uniref:Uncharacterized protein n=1 Tax=Anopheles dirus TaxID=7168 RepID=A0A182NK34_9DIPT